MENIVPRSSPRLLFRVYRQIYYLDYRNNSRFISAWLKQRDYREIAFNLLFFNLNFNKTCMYFSQDFNTCRLIFVVCNKAKWKQLEEMEEKYFYRNNKNFRYEDCIFTIEITSSGDAGISLQTDTTVSIKRKLFVWRVAVTVLKENAGGLGVMRL